MNMLYCDRKKVSAASPAENLHLTHVIHSRLATSILAA
jgi:hypothetical protein